MNDNFYKKLMEHSPEGYAYHQIITDGEGKPVDYLFLDANQAFERATGLSKGKIIGKKVTRVIPGIENSSFDWIGTYGKVALTGESISLKQYSETLGRWYNVAAHSNERGYFVAFFHDITADVEEKEALEILANFAHETLEQPIGKLDYEKLTDNILQLSGAKFAAINTYNKEGTKTVTRAISGEPESIRKASEIMGFELTGRAWDIIHERAKSIRGGCFLRFNNLYEASIGSISVSIQ